MRSAVGMRRMQRRKAETGLGFCIGDSCARRQPCSCHVVQIRRRLCWSSCRRLLSVVSVGLRLWNVSVFAFVCVCMCVCVCLWSVCVCLSRERAHTVTYSPFSSLTHCGLSYLLLFSTLADVIKMYGGGGEQKNSYGVACMEIGLFR